MRHAVALATVLLCLAPMSIAQTSRPGARPTTRPLTATSRPVENGTVVYADDFSKKPKPLVEVQWSSRKTADAPNGKVSVLGPYQSEIVELKLSGLPRHKYIRVAFDLVTIGSWDGKAKKWGVDHFWMTVEKGPKLVHTNFSVAANHTPFNQSYPDMYPFGDYSGRTGATGVGTLGFSNDMRFRFRVYFPHEAKDAVLKFAGDNLQAGDESWALTNLSVTTYDKPPLAAASMEDLFRLGARMAGADPSRAMAAMWDLVAAGPQASRVLQRYALGSKPKADLKDDPGTARLIGQLDDDDWRVREKASKALLSRIEEAEAQLRRALEADPKPSLEVQARIQQVLRDAGLARHSSELVRARAVWALGVLGTKDAQEILQRVSEKDSDPKVKELAATALRRLLKPVLKEQPPKMFVEN